MTTINGFRSSVDSPDCFQGANPPDAKFVLRSPRPAVAIQGIWFEIHFLDEGLSPPLPVTLRYTHCQSAYNDWYPFDPFGFTPLNQELVNDWRILGTLPRLGQFGLSGTLYEHGRDTPALLALLTHFKNGLMAKRNETLALKGEEGYGGN